MRATYRILDANFNRAREALRVLEDLARFQRDDERTAFGLKAIRHQLDRLSRPHRAEFLRAREPGADVGRDNDRRVESPRAIAEVAAANFKRVEEALRSIEELSKGRFSEMCRSAHIFRFSLYAIEKFFDLRGRLAAARLYVLLDPSVTSRPLPRVAQEAVRGGADVLQLRQKPRVDAGLALAIRKAAPDTLFIVNDRADVAVASGADGVHLGVEDLSIRDAKRLNVGIVGATTHSIAEAKRAVEQGADYISVGPMFPTPLKPDLQPRGRTYLAAARRLGIPWFCIGGITRENVEPGFGRVAVCAGVIAQRDPAAAAKSIRSRLFGQRGTTSGK